MPDRRTTVENLFKGRYEILEELPWNGIAYVFHAKDERNHLALTVLPIDCDSDKRNVRLFATFCDRLESARGTGLVPVVEYGVRHGVPFVAFEHVSATPLTKLATQKLGIKRTIPILRQLLGAMATAHASKIWHGDLTPNNVLVSDASGAQVFGLGLWPMIRATRQDNNTGPTGRGSGDQATHFMAPELLLGERGGTRSDQYSIAALCEYMLTGEVPPRPLVASKSYPKPLQDWVSQAGHKDPKQRFDNAADALSALNALYPVGDHPLWSGTARDEEDVVAEPEATKDTSSSSLKWVILVAALASVAALAWYFWPASKDTPNGVETAATNPQDSSDAQTANTQVADASDTSSDSNPVDSNPVDSNPVDSEPEGDQGSEGVPKDEPEVEPTTTTESTELKGSLAGPLAPPLDAAMKKVLAGYRFSDDEIKPLYEYARENRDDALVHIVLARAFMNRNWYTAALERYQQAMKKNMDDVLKNDSTLDDIIRIAARSEDEENFYAGFVLLKRLKDPRTLSNIEEAMGNTKQWRAKLRLERLQKRVTKLEKRRNR